MNQHNSNLPVQVETRVIRLPDHEYPGADLIRRENHEFTNRRSALREILVAGIDYGQYPGWPKPSLLVPGAQKIQMRLGLWTDAVVLDKWMDERGQEYGVSIKVTLMAGEQPTATGIGYADTFEKRRRDGSGSAWTGNTVYQMAWNRALKSACRTVSGLSDEFTQDVEDMPAPDSPVRNGPPQGRPPAQPAAPNSNTNGNGQKAPQTLGTCEWHNQPFTRKSGDVEIHQQDTNGLVCWCNGNKVLGMGGEVIAEREAEPCRHPAVEVIDGESVCLNCGRSWPLPKADEGASSSPSQAAGQESSATADRPTGPDADDCRHNTVEDDGYCDDCFRHVGFGYCEQEGCIGKGSAWLREKDGTRFHEIPGGQHVERAEERKERADDIPF